MIHTYICKLKTVKNDRNEKNNLDYGHFGPFMRLFWQEYQVAGR